MTLPSARSLLLGAAVLFVVSHGHAGCLAPTDVPIDGAGAVGPFWGSQGGELLYTRDPTGSTPQLIRRAIGGGPEVIAEAGVRNDFFIDISEETWSEFHAGTVSSAGDLAFVASTVIDDNPDTSENESLARRGVYALRGNSMYEMARFGRPSPISDGAEGLVPWGSFFDAAALARSGTGRARAVFSGQLGAPDGRLGVFRWNEDDFAIEPMILTGDLAPGGTFTSIARMRAGESGDVAFAALVVESLGGGFLPGLFVVHDDLSVERMVRFGIDGDPAPGGGSFALLSDFAIAGDGTVVFAATVVGGGGSTGLYRAVPPLYTTEIVVREGDSTPLGGTFGSFDAAKVRLTVDGDLVFGVRLSEDVGGEGVFALPRGGSILPLSNPESTLGVAALGADRGAYQTPTVTATVVPSDGSAEGPDDFRVVKIDVKNKVALRKDSVRYSGAFRLPGWGEGAGETAPVVLGPSLPGDARRTTDREWTGADLTRIAEVRIRFSQSPGNELAFGLDDAGAGLFSYNGAAQPTPKVKRAKDGASATWTFRSDAGKGKFTVDLADGTFELKLGRGSVLPSFESAAYRLALSLRTDADVTANRTEDAAFFHRSLLLAATQPNFGSGRRILSTGEGTPGGGLFVDTLTVKRKLKVVRGQAAPNVTSDSVAVTGTLRVCPGSTPPTTPGIVASLRVGDLVLDSVNMARRGKSGSRYRYKSPRGETPRVTLDLDAEKGSFAVKASGVPPLSQLTDADFSGAPGPNDASAATGGLDLPFALSIERVYEDAFDVPVVRARGGKAFTR